MDEDSIVFKRQKKALKDIEPMKDALSELTDEEPKNLGDIRKRLTKK
ncbi:hypothetical protein BMS3Abin16_00903 [archaeon BMS3Abin16]|nr:hypothetical protein BMS3Abin16_00903 [archaeon BMS3Abin16]GBE56794.1 hypothetical protein BMS3Bbin16_01005 [archaeon BMS3Bbin16]